MRAHVPEAAALVGRDRELDILRQHLAAAITGQGGLVLIGGEAGIGKTALADAICRECEEQGGLVLVGRCYDLTETPPYGPWVELFGQYRPTGALPSLPAAFAARGTVGAVTSQAALFGQVRDFLAALAAARPALLLLDDLHWADASSLDLLRFAARHLAALPLLLVVTYRSDELTRRHPLSPLLPALVREAAAERVDLHPLDDAAVRALVADRYHLPVPEAARLVAFVQGRAEGNALFAGEVLRSLVESGALWREGEGWHLGDLRQAALPPLLGQVIDARVSRLGGEGQRLLTLAAAVGQEAALAVLGPLAGMDEEALLAAVEGAAEAGLLTETLDGLHVRFAHALVREAVYTGISPARRRLLHRRIGELLAAQPHPDPDAVAMHFGRAADGRAVPWLIRAGNRAWGAFSLVSAAERYAAALELLDEAGAKAGERVWLVFLLARMRWLADPARALRDLDAAALLAETAGDRPLQVGIRYQRGFLLCMQGEMRRGIAELEAAVPAVAALSGPDRVHLTERGWGWRSERPDIMGLLPEWLAWTGRFDDALAAGEPVVQHAPEAAGVPADSHYAYASVHLGLAVAHAAKGRPTEARRAWAAARSFNLALDHAHQIGMNAFQELNWTVLPYRADRLAERRALADEAEAAWGRAVGARPDIVPATARLLVLLVEGRWDEARSIAIQAQTARSSGWSRQVPNRVLAEIARARGMADEAWARATELLPDGPDTAPGDTWILDTLPLLRLAALVAIDRGDLPCAQAWLAAHDRWLKWSGAVLGQSEGQLGWAAYYRAAGNATRAGREARVALEHASAPRQPLALLAAHRLLGEMNTDAGLHGAARTHLDAGLALADACAAPYERALTLLALAHLDVAAGDQKGARARLGEVRALCEPLGAKPALTRAVAQAARLDATEQVVQPYPAGLSEREVEVLRLVAAGKSNQDIANALFLSAHTVRHHLTHILAKTDSANRAEAVAFALRRGLA